MKPDHKMKALEMLPNTIIVERPESGITLGKWVFGRVNTGDDCL